MGMGRGEVESVELELDAGIVFRHLGAVRTGTYYACIPAARIATGTTTTPVKSS